MAAITTEDLVFSEEELTQIHANMTGGDELVTLRIAFQESNPHGPFESFYAYFGGDKQHVEINFDEIGQVGPAAFSSFGGQYEKKPTNVLQKGITWLKSFFISPTVMRGAYLLPRTYTPSHLRPDSDPPSDPYIFLAFDITRDQEKDLFEECWKMHYEGFNGTGRYRSIIPGFQQTTEEGSKFCSEAVLTALQKSNVIYSMIPSGHDSVLFDINPGSVTPHMLYHEIKDYGFEVNNQIYYDA